MASVASHSRIFQRSSLYLSRCSLRFYSSEHKESASYKLIVVGAGSGGSAIANKFANKLGNQNVAVIEPSQDHYYQPIWTLVGGGVKPFSASAGKTRDILPSQCDWIQEKAVTFNPEKCTVTTDGGKLLQYDYLVVAMGLQLNFEKVKGLSEALASDPSVVSNYHPQYVLKTHPAIQACQSGNAVFTFPSTPIKCPGAPQKIMYLAEEHFRQAGVRDHMNVIYNTALPRIFGVPKYAEALEDIVSKRNITVNTRTNLIEVKQETKEAVFENLDTKETHTTQYSLLHVGPPCSPPPSLVESGLADAVGFLDVNKDTLQHNKYKNVFGIGDCTSAPTSKTAAAVAAQSGILDRTMTAVMNGKDSQEKYDGYTSCPLITGRRSCILAEFGYEGKVMETFPVNQGVERRTAYHLKADFMPSLYWQALVKGRWHGPKVFRKLLSFGMKE